MREGGIAVQKKIKKIRKENKASTFCKLFLLVKESFTLSYFCLFWSSKAAILNNGISIICLIYSNKMNQNAIERILKTKVWFIIGAVEKRDFVWN